MLTRRAFLAGTGVSVALPVLPAHAAGNAAESGIGIESTSYALASQGPATAALHLAGLDAGGALRFDQGRDIALAIRNRTTEPMALDWRGLRGAGNLEQALAPIGPDQEGTLRGTLLGSGTALLRAAPSRLHCAERGVVGVVVVPDAAAPAVDHDVVVMLNDWLLASDNSLRFGSTPPGDAVANTITVNGASQPSEMKVVPRARLRLRFVNASAQRLMIVSCAGARPMVAAIDGQPSELFAPVRNSVPIGPGARYDLLLDMPDAANAPVRFTLKPTATINGKLEPERDLLVLMAEGTPGAAKPPLRPLPATPGLPVQIPLETARRVDLTFTGQPGTPKDSPAHWTVNGISGPAADKPVLTVRRGDPVVLGLFNTSPALVPLRIAGHAVRLLHAKDDGWEPYWRDTVLLPPGGRAHVAFVAETEGHWPIDSGFDDLTLAGLSCVFGVTPH